METKSKKRLWYGLAIGAVCLLGAPIVFYFAARNQGNASQLAEEGWRLWQSGQMVQAAEKFKRSVELEPKDPNAWNGLGWASFNSGNSQEAEKAFQKVIALQPDHPAALNGLGQIYLSQRKYDQAETYLLKAAPQAPAAWYGLARIYLIQGKFEKAEEWAQKVVDSGQGDETANKMLQAARAKRLSEGLRMMIEPPPSANLPPANSQTSKPASSNSKADMEKAAISAAEEWLTLIDEGGYSQSWKEAAGVFRAAVTEKAWVTSMSDFREPLGELISRKVMATQHATTLPGAPDGDYVIVQFETSFTGKKAAIETVTFMLEKDGKWKSSGYFVK